MYTLQSVLLGHVCWSTEKPSPSGVLVFCVPDVGSERLPALHEDVLQVGGPGRVSLMLLRDEERHGKGGLTRRAGPGVHQTRHGGRHFHLHV